jgi:hypothetical protein
VRSEDEEKLIYFVARFVNDLHNRDGDMLYGTTTPQKDNQVLGAAYMARVGCAPKLGVPDLEFSYYLFKWIIVRVGFQQFDLMCGMLRASLSRLWYALEEDDDDMIVITEYANHVFGIIEYVYPSTLLAHCPYAEYVYESDQPLCHTSASKQLGLHSCLESSFMLILSTCSAACLCLVSGATKVLNASWMRMVRMNSALRN